MIPKLPMAFLLALLIEFLVLPVNAATVVIDAGHGGHDRGGIPQNIIPEKGVALDVARRLQIILRNAGFRTIMTRSSDVFIPLGHRVATANRQRNAIFVSVHFNSATRRGACGIETYYYSRQSARLARDIHRYIVRTTQSDNRGIKRRGFYVLRNTRIPAVLLECGFLTNPHDAQLASSASYRQRLAQQLANGIFAYY